MPSLNKATLIGHLGQDPKTGKTQNDRTYTSFSIATNEKWTDKTTNEKKETTEWHNITAWGRTAEICDQYLKKGDPVYIEGKITTQKWTDKNGVDRWTTKIEARNVVLLGSKGESNKQPMPDEMLPSENYGVPMPKDEEDDDVPF